jgi:Flp pilus assembly protein TadB
LRVVGDGTAGVLATAGRIRRERAAELAARVLVATWREAGLAGCVRKLRAGVGMGLPVLVAGRRTAESVGAYFDLITDDGRVLRRPLPSRLLPPGRREPVRSARRAHRPGWPSWRG